jgi:hypothetical protein
MDQSTINIVGNLIGFILLALSSYCFYKAGWHRCNLQKHDFVEKQTEYLRVIYDQEKELRRGTITLCYENIKKFEDEIDYLNDICKEKDGAIASLEEANKLKNQIIEKWEKNPLDMYFQQPMNVIVKNESALFISPKEVFNGKPDS